MSTETIVTLILIIHLRKALQTKQKLPQWDKILLALLFITIGILITDVLFISEPVTRWLQHIILIMLIVTVYKNEEFKQTRTITYAVIPLLLIAITTDFLEVIKEDWYNTAENYLQSATAFSVIWIIAMLIVSNRQNKALKKDKLLREIEEEKKRVLETRKIELEAQVAERTAELTRQKEELQQALTELKATQNQLIQQEKMASLGELTAGIAHEIQNPLNFVNNFSEVSMELLDEMETELNTNNPEEAIAIARDIKQNLGKISQHGKRADSIVKGMLQHSRSTTGKKEPADINSLADEYLRLSYHGLRAKDKSFNAAMQTNFDESIGLVNIVAQDMGRVLLNLFNNAFYSVAEKKKENPDGYEALVAVETHKINGGIEIKVRDNGNGIPQKVLDKIYQPFFTTKPTGEGTGLGLSMTYDIVTKGHGGSMTADSKEGEFAEFLIVLPLT